MSGAYLTETRGRNPVTTAKIVCNKLVYALIRTVSGRPPQGWLESRWHWYRFPFSLRTKTLWSQSVEAWFSAENEDTIEVMLHLGKYEPLAWVEPHPGSVFLDVGGFAGGYTLRAAKAIGSAGRVIALEPDQTNRQQLERNLTLNDISNTTVLPLAAWSRTGLVRFHHDPHHPNWHKVDEGRGTDTVEAVTLDDLAVRLELARVDWIKLDIEGGEVEALRGADKILQDYAPTLFIEVHNTLPALEDLLQQHGYRIERAVFEEVPENHGWILARSIRRVQN